MPQSTCLLGRLKTTKFKPMLKFKSRLNSPELRPIAKRSDSNYLPKKKKRNAANKDINPSQTILAFVGLSAASRRLIA